MTKHNDLWVRGDKKKIWVGPTRNQKQSRCYSSIKLYLMHANPKTAEVGWHAREHTCAHVHTCAHTNGVCLVSDQASPQSSLTTTTIH